MKTSYVFFADGFEEIEALTVVDMLRRAGMPVTTVSINPDAEAIGAHGVTIATDSVYGDDDYSDAEWLILPGGMPGATNLAECEPLCEQIVSNCREGKNIAAICASPSIVFGPLGLLEGREAVCYPGMEDGMEGAAVRPDFAVTDGNIVTGRGPAAAADFALAIIAKSAGEAIANQVAAGMLLR